MDEQSTGANDLLFDVKDGIGRATFNRPQARNAVDSLNRTVNPRLIHLPACAIDP